VDLEHLIGQKLLFAFHGMEAPSPGIVSAMKQYHPGGITLFRHLNIGTLAQTRALTESLQRLARDLNLPPLLIAADQEGGQLMAVGDGTPLPGNMALGASRSVDLARKAGEVLGRELAALGINVNYAPCVDVNVNPQNPVVGVRSFGGDPSLVAELAAALIKGMQSQGLAATAKHFPGHGDTATDSHHGLGKVPHSLERLKSVELSPFAAALKADVKLVMTAHLAVPSIDGPDAPPATLSPNIINGLLRRDLGFDGVVITDAMDMRAIEQGEALRNEALRAVTAGADLLLITSDPGDQARAFEGLVRGAQSGRLSKDELQASVDRIARLKTWLADQAASSDLSVIRSAEHMKFADEIAERSITLVRDRDGCLPLKLDTDQRIAVVVPVPQDLTPADTSSYVEPKLVESIRVYHPRTNGFTLAYSPSEQEAAAVLAQVREYDAIVVGTINACVEKNQAGLVHELLKTGKPVIIIAMRLPYDAAAFPEATTIVCTYSIMEPSMKAVARGLFGFGEMKGRLPVTVPGLKEAG
jgi:beta-N-acetylhexosaminidase